MATDALVLDGLDSFYGDSHVLHDVSFSVGAGRVLGLLGRNGAGKSTCIGSIIGFVRSRARDMRLFGEPIAGLSPEALSYKGIGLVPQGRRIFPTLTVRENLTVAARTSAQGQGDGRPGWTLRHVYEAFPRLKEREKQFAGSLSGGEQQMLAICRALMTNPRLLLLDEPSEGLAPQIIQEVARVLVDLKRSGLAIVLVEQNTALATDIADDVVILNSGRVAHSGPVSTIRSNEQLLEKLLGIY
ncbi:branched-chain amino acid transport system ATP-binding protein [Skermanella aerolata]|uniref:ABC transporter ATP-binding protein n=1 Tax=Skermanella aerolata TaxID=393310 RepID=A0A512DN61_9PROT|nr:ABC transporter ATP-binding protein [Skermanella aerolata]KJB94313.1 ABC transporter [Skermanella aerolata KACC 11604]GEO37906.1 ABC transporter ATP-binding protein [Skermanella aerolata]